MSISEKATIREILSMPCFRQMAGQFVASSTGDWFKDKMDLDLIQLQDENPSWLHRDILFGLTRLEEVADTGKQYVFAVRDGVNLIYLPAKKKNHDPYAILMAGGAYGCVCTMVESLPVAAKLNELGMDCFCLNYRTATKSSFLKGLMPQPLDDLAAACRFIQNNPAIFDVSGDNYIIGGFSAGGHLCAMWGTAHRGARSYGISNPKLLILAYPLISTENLHGPAAVMIGAGMYGAGLTRQKALDYAANYHVDANFPPVYLVQAMDDDTVPIQDSFDIEKALKQNNVRHKIHRVPSGGHGFGLGTATPAKGWVTQALEFMDDECYDI